MRRVLVIGSSGSGKTRLTTRLAETLDLPAVFLDVHYWRPGWQASDLAAWRQRVSELAENSEWIMDGNFSETFDLRMPRADTLVWLDYPRSTCLRRVLTRSIKDHGRSRPDLPDGCPEQIDMKLLRWVWDFPVKERPQIAAGIARFGAHLRAVQLADDRAVAEFLRAPEAA
jgi:adenylate kinase family enzyme